MKDIVLTDKGPKPIGPYSQAVKSNGFLFASGQVALDPRSNEFVAGDIRQQTERVLENIKGILEAGGVNLHHVVKTTVFLKDMNDFAAMNEVYGRLFHSRSARPLHRPGRAPSQGRSGRNRSHRVALVACRSVCNGSANAESFACLRDAKSARSVSVASCKCPLLIYGASGLCSAS